MSHTNNLNRSERICPAPEPDGETPVPENPAFLSACMRKISTRAALSGARLGKSLLTHSEIWGFVFRIDIQSKAKAQNPEFNHRFICWSAEEDDAVMGTALIPGYKLKPL
jgi:hypothetical protein